KMMDCRLYEVAMKVESYTGSANGGGSAHVTRNLLTLENAPANIGRAGGAAAMSAGGVPRVSVQGRTLNVTPVDGSDVRIQIRDVNGKNRGRFNSASPATSSLSHIPAGRYFVDVTGAAGRHVTPIVLR